VPSSNESEEQTFGVDSPSADYQITSPIGTRLLKKKVRQQAGFDAEDTQEQGMVDDPNQCSSPYSTELIHRRVAFQQAKTNDSVQGMVDDPNQCSSPGTTELIHRRVAFQRAREEQDLTSSLGPQLSSPVGTALLNKKLARQRRSFDHASTEGGEHAPTLDGNLTSLSPLSVTASEVSLRSSASDPKMSADELNDEEAPAIMGVPARTAWEAKAADSGGNPLANCLRCFERK